MESASDGSEKRRIQVQRMMEWVLDEQPHTDHYMDDTITGSKGQDLRQAILANYEYTRDLLRKYEVEQLVCSFQKSKFFEEEVVFCGHLLRTR